MTMRDLIPWGRGRSVPAPRFEDQNSPFLTLHREMNRLFDDFFHGFDWPLPSRFGWSGGWPHVDVGETEKEVKVVAELPGLDERDVDVMLHDGVLTLKGEKRAENDGAWYSERWAGRFQRSIPLGPDVDPDKVEASFRNGVLTVTVGKRPEPERAVRRIPIKG
jgi:HSP20 family protein